MIMIKCDCLYLNRSEQSNASGIEPPDGVIEKGGKAHPEYVRNQKQGSVFADGPEPYDALQYEEPEDHNYYECGQRRLQTKESIGPENINQELGSKYTHGNFGVCADNFLLPDQK